MSFPPWLALSLLLALILALVHQLTGRRFGWRVLGYWLVIFAGFLGAELFSENLNWNVTRLGDLRLLPDLGGALAVVALLRFLRL